MKKILCILLLLPFIGIGQVSHNGMSRVTNEGIIFPATPHEINYFPSRTDTTMNCVYEWDDTASTGHWTGASKKALQPYQVYMGFPNAWKKGLNGTGVKVCVIDAGLHSYQTHKDITIQGFYGNNFGDWNHAMIMTSIIGARDNGGSGVIGGAYNCGMYETDYFDVLTSVNWALSQGCRVFNCSFDFGYGVPVPQSVYTAFKKIADANGVVVVSAGNNRSTVDVMQAMCAIPNVICVAAQTGGSVRTISDSLWTVNVLPVNRKYLDFAAPNYILAASFKSAPITSPTSNYYAVDGGSSSSAAVISSMYAILMQRFPILKVGILTELLKAHSHTFISHGVVIRIPNLNWIR